EDAKRAALVVLTSARGLAGGCNAHVLRAAVAHLDEQAGSGIETRVHMIGKKGIGYFRFLRRPMAEQTPTFGERPKFEQVEPIANALIDAFLAGEIGSAYVAYMRFVSAGQQRPEVLRLLPLTGEEGAAAAAEKPAPGTGQAGTAAPAARPRTIDYELSPSPRELLDELLPAIIRARLFQALNDALVSEQVARMIAMKAATDAAGDMIKALSRQYNRARQTQITMELLDIVGGSNALS
ncbi:MAG TPA: FoF1 ATP synthase subunit gamma, partial [Thermoanaerobaculia bacterium]|nr:FoF1 ATP synthase subunit gamma [Thermoanaerobaculia bacterium]